MKIPILASLLCLSVLTAPAQSTELFVSLHTGGPFASDDNPLDVGYWNYSIGIEQYMADKVSVAVSYRGVFSITGASSGQDLKYLYTGNGDFEYYQQVSSSAWDFESKYFWDSPDDGGYISSGISLQRTERTIVVESASYNYTTSPSPINEGTYTEDAITTFPVSIKLGDRRSGDTFVTDYFLGVAYNVGAANAAYKYDTYFHYDPMKSFTFMMGVKLGVKF